MEEYNIGSIIEWLNKVMPTYKNKLTQRRFFEAIMALHRLDTMLYKESLKNVDTESTDASSAETTDTAAVESDAIPTDTVESTSENENTSSSEDVIGNGISGEVVE